MIDIGNDEEQSVFEYLKSLTILCVEDNKTTQFVYDAIFEDYIGEIIFADDGLDGYNKFVDNKIDLIITDYEMPKENGIDMSIKIRELDKDIPIILVSAIEDINVIVEALRVNISNFIKKPISSDEVLSSVVKASKFLIVNRYLEEQRKKKIAEYQAKDEYKSYQEDLALAKELNILRNDFYYQMIDTNGVSLVDFLYHPLDVVSGDAYSARIIDSHNTFYLMVDGMGKGLSASLSAMLMTSFINHIIDKMIDLEAFDFSILIHESIGYIKPILLEEEALSIDYILINNDENMLYYSKFAMPTLLMQTKDNDIVKLKSNNPPLSKWQDTFNVDSYNIKDITKFLIYSDGIVENITKKNVMYADCIEGDFLNSFTREDLKESFFSKIDTQEDDVTLIYIHKLQYEDDTIIESKVFDSSLEDVDKANDWYSDLWQKITLDSEVSYPASLVFTELFLNAFEHGNLGIDSDTKNSLLEDDIYYETLEEKAKDCFKKIDVRVHSIKSGSVNYIITQITDEGDGFNTQILSEIFRHSQTFNGRGVFVSRKNSAGIYYNSKGNSVLYLNKI